MKKRKTISQRLLALTLCLLCLLAALPIAALADDAAEPTTEPTTLVTQAPSEPGDADPSAPSDPDEPVESSQPSEPEASSEPSEPEASSEPSEPENSEPQPSETTEPSEPENSEPTETTAPAETEEQTDPVQALYEQLMACQTLDEINAILYPETEEERVNVEALIAQFTEEQNAALVAKMDELGAYDVDTMEELGSYTVAIGNTLQVNASEQNRKAESFSCTLEPFTAGIVCTKKETQGTLKGYTFKIDNSVPDGTYIATVKWKYKARGDVWVTDRITINVISNPVNASVFYLIDPTHEPSDNATSAWGNEILQGTINKRGLTYVASGNISNKNYFIQEGDGRVLTMPDGMEYDESSRAYSLPKEKFGDHWTYIWYNWGDNFKTQYNNQKLTLNDIEMIYLKPYKLSQNNSVKEGYSYADHIDCTISIKLKEDFAARFWVTLPGSSEAKVVDYATYHKGDDVKNTTKAPTSTGDYKETIVVDGISYVFDGWYNEAGQKVTEWDYTPTETELSDGVVEFYAHYTPMSCTLTITKEVAGNMLSHNDVFSFTVTGNVADTDKTFTLKHGESKTITVNIGDTITVTEESGNYSTTYKVGENGTVTEGASATITVTGDETITFTNTHNVTIDTGILLDTLPYILILAVVALGAVGMLRKRRSRDED